ncbi:MAG: cytidine deaminase [Verrucomicrobium sp.]|nr:cytidine deaminase [Verrucomicrobium sp.]
MEPLAPALLEELKAQARDAHRHAHTSVVPFGVGAAVLTEDGKIHQGANIQNLADPHLNICSERVAAYNALSEAAAPEGRRIRAVAIYSETPEPITCCGACRQTLAGLCEADTPVVSTCADEAKTRSWTMGELLPEAFTRKGSIPVAPQAGLRVESADAGRLLQAAQEAAGHAYLRAGSPPRGAAVLTASGKVFASGEVEGNAFTARHAEDVAVFKAISHAEDEGDKRIVAVALYTDGPRPGVTSGSSLEILREFAGPEMRLESHCRDAALAEAWTMAQLLPAHYAARRPKGDQLQAPFKKAGPAAETPSPLVPTLEIPLP